jgi:predicted GNAT family N-acyltransferase
MIQSEELVVKSPSETSAAVISRFVQMILTGGAIVDTSAAIETRIRKCVSLIYKQQNGIIVGIAALKVPVKSYRERIGQSTGYDISESQYPYEVGYVVIEESARGQGLSQQLVEAVISQASPAGLFATTSSPAMHIVLPRVAFKKVGCNYKGADKNMLSLYTRDTPKIISQEKGPIARA